MSKEMLELADRITSHLVTLASTNTKLSLTEWSIIRDDVLSAVAALRASAVAEPVAWQWRRKSDIGGFGGWSVTSIRPIGEVYDLAPLYTHPAPAAPVPASVSGDLTEEIAKWLHEETNHPDSYPDRTWPETDRDDGQRESGWVKMVPAHALAQFRDIARRLVARFGASLPAPEAAPTRDGRHPVESLWRECGLPEYFLGNDGSNTKLYALYDAILALKAAPHQRQGE